MVCCNQLYFYCDASGVYFFLYFILLEEPCVELVAYILVSAGFRNLKVLNLGFNEITDACLVHLKGGCLSLSYLHKFKILFTISFLLSLCNNGKWFEDKELSLIECRKQCVLNMYRMHCVRIGSWGLRSSTFLWAQHSLIFCVYQ